MGAWASKFRMGSTLPLVEIRLRMGPRSTVVTRTLIGPCRVNTGIIARQATTPAMIQGRRLRFFGLAPLPECPFELWFEAKFIFAVYRRYDGTL
jgi:hypothetical protein